LRVYLSSTLSDLESERTKIKQVLSGECIVIESYEADPRPLWQSCIADVKSCDLYICVVGLRYGFTPPGQPKSITELEFDAAVGTGIPCLVFMKTSSSITVDKSDGGTGEHPPQLILDFRARLSSGGDGFSRPANFSTLSELTERVLKALLRLRSPPDPRLVSADGEIGAAGVVRPATPPALPAAVRPNSSAAISGQTELQGMLWRFLNEHWLTVRSASLFQKTAMLARFKNDDDSQGLFDLIVNTDGMVTVEALRLCFMLDGSGGRFPYNSHSGIAFDAVLLMALMGIERWLENDPNANSLASAMHAPLLGDDPLIVCILAATLFRFGLQFKAGSVLPINVLAAKLPMPELMVPVEEGALLIGGEILEMHSRLLYGIDEKFERAGSVRTLKGSIKGLNDFLKCSLVVAAPCSGFLSKEEARMRLVDDFKGLGARVYFRPEASGDVPAQIKSLLDDIRYYLSPFLQPFRSDKQESPSVTKLESPPPPAPSVTNNFTFNGPVGAVAQANAAGSQAAGRDILNGASAPDIAQMLNALRQVIDGHPALAGVPDKRETLQDQVELITQKATAESRSDKDAPLVKRYLERLKEGAEAVENGSTIFEKLSPLWDGLKATWPAFAALIS
jgi:hypothetical protein